MALAGAIAAAASFTASAQGSVTLAWDPSSGAVAGYNLYQGVASRTYTNVTDVGNVTQATVSGLVNGAICFFAVTAYDLLGLESDFSNEITYTVPAPTNAPTLTSIAVTPPNPAILLGTIQQFTATGTYSDGSIQDLTSQVTWSSSGALVAIVSPTGLVIAVSLGNTTISATLNGVTGSAGVSVAPALSAVTLWPSTAMPTVVDVGSDSAVELGVKFSSDVPGSITGVRFYKGSANTGTHVGNLWSSAGTLLASATFNAETDSGWQQVNFAMPVAIDANTVYVASCHVESGHYSIDDNYFALNGVDNAPLHAPAESDSGGNGVYAYGSTSTFPHQTWQARNYWVDVVWQAPAPPVVLTSIAVTPANLTLLLGTAQQFTATGSYSDGSTQDLTSQATWSSASADVATVSATGLATAISAGSTAISAALNGVTGSSTLISVAPPPPPRAAVTLWPSTAVPTVVDAGPDDSVELGVQFTSDVAGSITGIRFYKASANTGTHVGNLWSSAGTLLASATFTAETDSGWQQVSFATPVAIDTNTVYVASYHLDGGHYSADDDYFATSGVDNPPLHAPDASVSDGNGVYAYGSASAFPNQTWQARNYWVDVAWQAAAASALTSTAVTPAKTAIALDAKQQFTGNANPPETGLPAPWQTVDIGNVAVAGNATSSGDSFSVAGAGQISGTADSFRFLYQPMSGDGEIDACISSAQNTGTAGSIGVMIRESLTSGAEYAFMGISPDGVFRGQRRSQTGGTSSATGSDTGAPPNVWARLVRAGAAFYGYESTDGTNWTLVNARNISMATNVYVGLAVASGTSNVLNSCTFTNLTVVP